MGDFYEDMAAMARDLLAPTSKGGLGQGVLAIVRKTPSTPSNEWDTPTYTTTTEVLNGAVRGVSAQLVSPPNMGVGGPIVLATDLTAVCTPPKQDFGPGDVFTIDGIPVTVVRHDKLPAAGVTVAVRFILRG